MNTANSPKKQAILEAAKRAFIAQGYSGASMEAIAEAAPVSKPTLYKHFHGKQDLFAAVIASQCEALLTTLADLTHQHDEPLAGLQAIAESFVDLVYAEESIQLYRLIIAEQQHFPELGELVYRSGPVPVLQHLADYLSELHHLGVLNISDVETSSRLFFDMLKGDSHFRCLLGLQKGLSDAERQHLLNAAISLFVRGHRYDTHI